MEGCLSHKSRPARHMGREWLAPVTVDEAGRIGRLWRPFEKGRAPAALYFASHVPRRPLMPCHIAPCDDAIHRFAS